MKRSAVVCVFACLMAAGAVVAQETTGAIIGTITSQDGRLLPGVTISLVDQDRGFLRTAVSAGDGRFSLLALPPARYDLTASVDGFQNGP